MCLLLIHPLAGTPATDRPSSNPVLHTRTSEEKYKVGGPREASPLLILYRRARHTQGFMIHAPPPTTSWELSIVFIISSASSVCISHNFQPLFSKHSAMYEGMVMIIRIIFFCDLRPHNYYIRESSYWCSLR